MTIIKGKVAVCELCGECEELRPYGPNKEWICYTCGMKDEETTEKRFKEIINNTDDQVIIIVPPLTEH